MFLLMVMCDQIVAVILEHTSGKSFTHWSETVVAVTPPPPTSPQLQTSISLLQYLAVWSDFKMHSDVAPWAARERWEILTSAPQEPALPWNVLRMRPRSQISAIIVIPALSQFWKTSVFLKMIQISATHPPQRLLEQTWRSAPGMRNVFLQQWRAEQRQLVFCYTLMVVKFQ